ncbi:MAG: hypothetical protein H6624_09795 [Bdellovibrionaceae bacterium]|nr:hypothetical protein [Bdellovibrionales bacterium]MCB9084629.1 hypothetical protein [Pseudobdellovibrionaceae bacterium]
MRVLVLTWLMAVGLGAKGEGFLDGEDRKNHVVISTVVTAAGYGFLRSQDHSRWSSAMGAIALGVFAGALKEVADQPMDVEDLQADGAGAGLGLILAMSFDW